MFVYIYLNIFFFQFQMMFCQVVIADFIGSWLLDRILRFLFGEAKLKQC